MQVSNVENVETTVVGTCLFFVLVVVEIEVTVWETVAVNDTLTVLTDKLVNVVDCMIVLVLACLLLTHVVVDVLMIVSGTVCDTVSVSEMVETVGIIVTLVMVVDLVIVADFTMVLHLVLVTTESTVMVVD